MAESANTAWCGTDMLAADLTPSIDCDASSTNTIEVFMIQSHHLDSIPLAIQRVIDGMKIVPAICGGVENSKNPPEANPSELYLLEQLLYSKPLCRPNNRCTV